MRLVAKRRQADRSPKAVEKTLPPPVGGWNARDSLGGMPPTDAVKLTNWFPRPSYCEMRGGCEAFATNLQGDIQTLATHVRPSGFSVLIVFMDTTVTLATFSGDYSGNALVFPAVTRTVGRHQWVQFGDGSETWTIAVNGADKPFYYRGSTGSYVLVDGVTSPAITGLTTTDIVNVAVFKNRLLFIRNDKLGFDYITAGAAGGAATYYDLSPFATRGGYLMTIAVWTRDAGNGPDDYAVFITSEGEALVYAGTDPSSANTWSLVGTFHIGRPLGRKCVTKFGADPLVLTENGLFPLSSLLASGDEREKFAVSFKIQDAFEEAGRKYFDHIGWQVISFPRQDAILVNVPMVEDGRHDQFVMNTINKSWCRFKGWNAEEFIIHKTELGLGPGELLFSRGRQIFKAWVGTSDNGDEITAEAVQAYQDFGTPYIKEPIMYMPVFTDSNVTSYSAGIDTDFEDRGHTSSATVPETSVWRWGTAQWGISRWGRAGAVVRQWGGVATWPGRWLAGKLKIVSDSVSVRWVGSVIRFHVGSGL